MLSTTHFLSSFPPSDVLQLFPETLALCRASQKMIFIHCIFLKENAVGTSKVGKQSLIRRRSARQYNGTRGHKYNASEIQQHRRGNTLCHFNGELYLQSTPGNSNLLGKSKKVRIIGSSRQIPGNKKMSKWNGARMQVSCTLHFKGSKRYTSIFLERN